MSQEHEDNTDALLRDLETRSSTSTVSVDDDDEDLEAFLASLEDDSPAPARPVATKPKPAPAPNIKEAPKAELQVSEPKKEEAKAPEAEKPAATSGEKVRKVGVVLKFSLVAVSTLGIWWLLGAYLAQWISAWWLILGLATFVVGIFPPALRFAAKQRGKLSWWFAGVSTALLLLLTAPIPNQAAGALGSYGHWPATSIALGASMAPDWIGVRALNWVSATLASSLSPESTSPLVLGSIVPLTQGSSGAVAPGPSIEPEAEAVEATEPTETEPPPPTAE